MNKIHLHFFFRSSGQSRGVVGIMKAESPTESRPRHTAMFAGVNEDISYIRNGKCLCSCLKNLLTFLIKSHQRVEIIGWHVDDDPYESIFQLTQRSWVYGDDDIRIPLTVNDSAINERMLLREAKEPNVTDDEVLLAAFRVSPTHCISFLLIV